MWAVEVTRTLTMLNRAISVWKQRFRLIDFAKCVYASLLLLKYLAVPIPIKKPFQQVMVLSQQKSGGEGYWDRVAEETKSSENVKPGEYRIAFKNWVAEYADIKTKDLLLKTVDKFIVLPKTAQILDVGCGPGKWTKMYAQKGFLTTGIDASLRMIQLARGGKVDAEKVNLWMSRRLGFKTHRSTWSIVSQFCSTSRLWRNGERQ
jgi:hypothetical protein